MKYRLIYFLEIVVGKILSQILAYFSTRQDAKVHAKLEEIFPILFVKFIEQGAWVLHLPVILYTQKILGAKNVYICTFESNRSFIKALDFIDNRQVYYINDRNMFSFAFSYLSQALILRRSDVKTSIDLEFLSNSSIIFSVLAGIKFRAGYVDNTKVQPRDKLITHPLIYSPNIHVSETGKKLLQQFFQINQEQVDEIFSDYKFSFSKNLLQNDILFSKIGVPQKPSSLKIIIHPNFIDALPLRSWPLNNYAELIHNIKKSLPTSTILLTGMSAERLEAKRFIEGKNWKDVHNLCGGTTWLELFALYKQADILICSDSGPAHFASLLGLKTIVMFGPETPELYRPLGENVEILYKRTPCSPCYNVYNHRMSSCQNNICMQEISVEEVMSKMQVLLEKDKNYSNEGTRLIINT